MGPIDHREFQVTITTGSGSVALQLRCIAFALTAADTCLPTTLTPTRGPAGIRQKRATGGCQALVEGASESAGRDG